MRTIRGALPEIAVSDDDSVLSETQSELPSASEDWCLLFSVSLAGWNVRCPETNKEKAETTCGCH